MHVVVPKPVSAFRRDAPASGGNGDEAMGIQGLGFNQAIVDFQKKRGNESIAFLLPFLRPEMALADIGCGPGQITAAFCPQVRSVTGLDIEARVIGIARSVVEKQGIANLHFIEGDMLAMPFDDDSLDVVFFHAVLYHQNPDVLRRTLGEARRVLKPGGLLATRDTDTGGNILYPETEGLLLSLDLWQRWYRHASDDATKFGRRQGVILRAHGFQPIWSGASYVNHSATPEIRQESVADARKSLEHIADGLISKGLATAEEVRSATAAWDAWGREPDAVYLRCRCECVACKP
jgi:SAM-dependent methyltransferase